MRWKTSAIYIMRSIYRARVFLNASLCISNDLEMGNDGDIHTSSSETRKDNWQAVSNSTLRNEYLPTNDTTGFDFLPALHTGLSPSVVETENVENKINQGTKREIKQIALLRHVEKSEERLRSIALPPKHHRYYDLFTMHWDLSDFHLWWNFCGGWLTCCFLLQSMTTILFSNTMTSLPRCEFESTKWKNAIHRSQLDRTRIRSRQILIAGSRYLHNLRSFTVLFSITR